MDLDINLQELDLLREEEVSEHMEWTQEELDDLGHNLEKILDPIQRFLDSKREERMDELATAEDHLEQLERHCLHFNMLEGGVPRCTFFVPFGVRIQNMLDSLETLVENIESGEWIAPRYERSSAGGWCRVLDKDQLIQCVEQGATNMQMARIFDVSRATIQRRKREWNILNISYSNMSDDQLDKKIEEIQLVHYNTMGVRSIVAALLMNGFKVQRERVRMSLQRIDPQGVVQRRSGVITRRTYYVPFPNSLWHIDGYHKLIRWKFVIHGGIDGKTRAIVYLKVASNNRADTVGLAFSQATQCWGWPSRVRADHGTENVVVEDLMNRRRGEHRGSFIKGKSVHNQRIERLWLDVWKKVCSTYHKVFHHLEGQNMLDLNNDVSMFCLHYVYLPRLQFSLDYFQSYWNHHKISGTAGMSPNLMFLTGKAECNRLGLLSDDSLGLQEECIPECFGGTMMYGVDEDAASQYNDRDNADMRSSVTFHPPCSVLSKEEIVRLQKEVPVPYNDCSDFSFGMETYLSALELVSDIIENRNSDA